MYSTTPNKETIRRLCILNGATFCYLLIRSTEPFAHIFSDIDCKNIGNFSEELEAWCGMKILVCNEQFHDRTLTTIKKNGEKILPIRIDST